MKLWVVLVAAALLAGCGADPAPLETPPPPTEAPPPAAPPAARRLWQYLGVLGGAAQNVTSRLGEVLLVQRLRSLAAELESQAKSLRSRLDLEVAEARARAAEYGPEARAVLEQAWAELKNRGASYSRKLRRRLNRDGEELRRRWEGLGQAWGDSVSTLRRSWGAPQDEEI